MVDNQGARPQKNIPVADKNINPVGVLNTRGTLQILLEDAEYEEQLLRDHVMCVGHHC